MNLDRFLDLLRTIAILNALQHKEGSYRLGQISQWSRVSRATCDRALREMVALGLLSQSEGKFNNLPCRLFAIADDGHSLMHLYNQ